MCGIAGKLSIRSEPPTRSGLQAMLDIMRHRGPDGQGIHLDGPIGLGHLRLSIIDLATGAQPLANEDNSVWITFNGEIYNYQELRADLVTRGHCFKTASDTEVIVHLYEEYGVESLQRLRGMFAFAIWDAKKQQLFVARDRLGIKPLYYADTGKSFLFASEMKALLTDPEVARYLHPQSIDRFVTHYYSPGAETLFKSIRKLEPGHYLLVDHSGAITQKQYWDLNFQTSTQFKTLDDAAAALVEQLRESVRLHMISDVPVGFLLSGGVDSTGLLSYAVSQTNKEISTFTIGFAGEGFADERPYAKRAAQRFGTRHHEISMTPDDFRDFLPRYVWHMEEPVCEPPAVALYYVSKLARDHVKVLLSGEGGDEAFGGYPNYRNNLILESFKRGAGSLCPALSRGLSSFARWTGSSRAAKYAPLLNLPMSEYYFSRASSPFTWFNQSRSSLYTSDFLEQISLGNSTKVIRELFRQVADQDLLSQMLYVDTKTWLPDDLLIKADKITMANSLELRVPLLDHKLMEFAASLPSEYKAKGLNTKRVLKKAFTGEIPEEIIKRKKTGFPVPYGRWLNRELKDYVTDLLTSEKAVSRGIFQKKTVQELLAKSQSDGSATKEIFSLISLELWHQKFADSPDASDVPKTDRDEIHLVPNQTVIPSPGGEGRVRASKIQN